MELHKKYQRQLFTVTSFRNCFFRKKLVQEDTITQIEKKIDAK